MGVEGGEERKLKRNGRKRDGRRELEVDEKQK